MKMNDLILIACADREWGIGKNGGLLFHIKRDMARFRDLTTGNAVIMGRKTFESLPDKKPLKSRVNIVMTRGERFSGEGIIVCRSVDGLEKELCKHPGKKAFVAGGGEIYSLLLPYCGTALVTRVDASGGADAFMPDLDSLPDWALADKSETFTEDGVSFAFCTYVRRRGKKY